MTNKPVYEIVKVLKHKVFIVGFGWKDNRPLISDFLEIVYEELTKIYPNKKIVFTDDIGDETYWQTMYETKFESDKSPTGYGFMFCDYNGEIPRIKGWEKICPDLYGLGSKKVIDLHWDRKPVYEIVKVLGNKVFIVGLGDPCISNNLESVHEELTKIHPNKRIIFIDDVEQIFENPWWYEIIEDIGVTDKSGFTDYELSVGYKVEIAQYNEEPPDIRPWDKILKPQGSIYWRR